MLVYEVVGFGVAFAFVWAGSFALTSFGVGAGGPFSAIRSAVFSTIVYN